jgi:hypothetical protein
MPDRTRYCQRCSLAQVLHPNEGPSPCAKCGGTNFDFHPKRHAGARGYELEAWLRPDRGMRCDQDFLRTQGIDPEDD